MFFRSLVFKLYSIQAGIHNATKIAITIVHMMASIQYSSIICEAPLSFHFQFEIETEYHF